MKSAGAAYLIYLGVAALRNRRIAAGAFKQHIEPRTDGPLVCEGRPRDAIHVSERPAEAEDRAIPGHWEGDLLLGKGNSAIATLVERSGRFAVLVRLPNGRSCEAVFAALKERIMTFPEHSSTR